MKYSEFERTVKSMGLFINDREGEIYVEDDSQFPVLTVSKLDEMVIDTEYPSFIELPYGKKDTLLILVVTLAKTPLVEREEEKRYRLRYDVPPLLRVGRARPQYPNIRQTVSPYRVFRAPKKSSRNQKSRVWTLQVSRRWR